MTHLRTPKWLASGLCALLLGACAHKPTNPEESHPTVKATPPPPSTLLLKEARRESDHLRSELASLKILMAKQAGELRSLREQTQSIRTRETDQGNQLQSLRGELLSAKAEQDQLRRRNEELEGQVSSTPKTDELLATIQHLRDSFQKVMTNMKSLVADIKLIKREMKISEKNMAPKQITLRPSKEKPSNSEAHNPDAQGKIIIRYGDTLWRLSRKYHVSVKQLKEWNDLDSDFIMTGFRLQVIPPKDIKENETNNEKLITQPSSNSQSIHANQDNSEIQVKESATPESTATIAQDNKPKESKHILSIGNPQSDTHETP